jgi:hypothetical protein
MYFFEYDVHVVQRLPTPIGLILPVLEGVARHKNNLLCKSGLLDGVHVFKPKIPIWVNLGVA